MTRTFPGRMSEELYNSELYKLFEVLKPFLDVPADSSIGPATTREGALWLDRQSGNDGEIKFYEDGQWKLLFENRFKIVGEIMAPTEPQNPISGQLWLKEGTLMYYNGADWIPAKSVNVTTEFNFNSFENFLMINPIPAAGSQVVEYVDLDGNGTKETAVYKSQFLMPNVEQDKFFINGTFTDDYEVVSNVAIQYPSESLNGKVASAVHINPKNLTSIKKKLIFIDKANPIIGIPEKNTEYYGIKDGVGHLLLSTGKQILIDNTTEYEISPEGIKLAPVTALLYDYVLAVTYVFSNTTAKVQGVLSKKKTLLSGTKSIYIGTVSDPMNIYVQGMYLDEDPANYTYDPVEGYLHLTSIPSKVDIGIVSFSQKEKGTITTTATKSIEGSNETVGVITMAKTYTKPLVFVYGENMHVLADYIIGEGADAGKLFVRHATVGMKYSIVESMGATDDAKLFIKSGTTTNNVIPCSFTEVPGDMPLILFANGLLVSQRDIDRDDVTGDITVYGLTEGMHYSLLQDPAGRMIFNDIVSFTTIPTGKMDDALVYVENHLICDSSIIYTTALPARGLSTHGELKLLIANGTEQWYRFNIATDWEPVLDPTEIQKLNASALGYSVGRSSISILQNFGAVYCTCYSYSFANAVEEPLLRGNIKTNTNTTAYKVAFNHLYPTRRNALSVYLNGLRQYPCTAGLELTTPDGIVEIDSSNFSIPTAVAADLFYVIERPEKSETLACRRQVLDYRNVVPGTQNIFRTEIALTPGNLRVYIGGIRQTPNTYRIIDPYTIMVKDKMIGGSDDFDEAKGVFTEVLEVDGEYVNIEHKVVDKILVEVRQDYNLKEVTLPVREQGQNSWSVQLDKLPEEILYAKDFVMIYINGFAYGKQYSMNKDTMAIILNDFETTKNLGVDPIAKYFGTDIVGYNKWLSENPDYSPRKDYITFEWR